MSRTSLARGSRRLSSRRSWDGLRFCCPRTLRAWPHHPWPSHRWRLFRLRQASPPRTPDALHHWRTPHPVGHRGLALPVAHRRYEPLITIGANVNLSDHVHLACTNRVTVGDGVLSGSRVIITDHSHGIYGGGIYADQEQSSPEVRPVERSLSNDKTVVIGRNVWLGDGVAVLAGAAIGDGAIIGANSVVNGTVPAFCIAVGAPARPIRRWDVETSQWIPWNG